MRAAAGTSSTVDDGFSITFLVDEGEHIHNRESLIMRMKCG